MKKSNIILLVIIVLISITVTVVYFTKNTSSEQVLRDFAIEDTAAITKIFLADKNNNTVLLERKNGYWTANGDYVARRDFLNVMLSTLKNMEVSSPVPELELDRVMKSLSVKGIKAEIYQNDELVKTFYVGGVTKDNTGTYMILEGSEIPFVMHIPGFTGFLSVRFLPYIDEWRERIVFRYNLEDIAQVRVEYPNNQDDSFIVSRFGYNSYGIADLKGNDVGFQVDSVTLKEYISRLKFLGLEAYISNDLKNNLIDSLLNEPMVGRYTVMDTKGKSKELKLYYRKNINQAVDDDGNLYDWDIDRLYGVVENDSEVVLLQYYTIDPIIFKKSDFNLTQ